MRKFHNKISGFTLAEVLVAVMILTLITLPTLTSFMMGRISTDVAKHRTQAMNLIRARLEYLNSKGYNFVNELSMETEDLYLDVNESGESNSCTRTTVVTDVDADDLLEIEVTVAWNERRLGGDTSLSESIITLMAPTRLFE